VQEMQEKNTWGFRSHKGNWPWIKKRILRGNGWRKKASVRASFPDKTQGWIL